MNFAPSQRSAGGFIDWLGRMDAQGELFLSVVTVHEIEIGVALLERKGATAKAAALKSWLVGLCAAYAHRILGLDAVAASPSGRLEAKALSSGYDPGMADALVAGVGRAHDLIVVTRNVKDFAPFGVRAARPRTSAQPRDRRNGHGAGKMRSIVWSSQDRDARD